MQQKVQESALTDISPWTKPDKLRFGRVLLQSPWRTPTVEQCCSLSITIGMSPLRIILHGVCLAIQVQLWFRITFRICLALHANLRRLEYVGRQRCNVDKMFSGVFYSKQYTAISSFIYHWVNGLVENDEKTTTNSQIRPLTSMFTLQTLVTNVVNRKGP